MVGLQLFLLGTTKLFPCVWPYQLWMQNFLQNELVCFVVLLLIPSLKLLNVWYNSCRCDILQPEWILFTKLIFNFMRFEVITVENDYIVWVVEEHNAFIFRPEDVWFYIYDLKVTIWDFTQCSPKCYQRHSYPIDYRVRYLDSVF